MERTPCHALWASKQTVRYQPNCTALTDLGGAACFAAPVASLTRCLVGSLQLSSLLSDRSYFLAGEQALHLHVVNGIR